MMFQGLPRCGWRELRKWESRWLKFFLRCQIFIMLMHFSYVGNDHPFLLTFHPAYNFYNVNHLIRLTWTVTNFAWFKMRKRLPRFLQTGKICCFSHTASKPPFVRGSEVAKRIRGKNSLWSKVKWKCFNKTHRLLWKHLWRCCPTWGWRWGTGQRGHSTPSSSCFSARGWNFNSQHIWSLLTTKSI